MLLISNCTGLANTFFIFSHNEKSVGRQFRTNIAVL